MRVIRLESSHKQNKRTVGRPICHRRLLLMNVEFVLDYNHGQINKDKRSSCCHERTRCTIYIVLIVVTWQLRRVHCPVRVASFANCFSPFTTACANFFAFASRLFRAAYLPASLSSSPSSTHRLFLSVQMSKTPAYTHTNTHVRTLILTK